jgi:hypothetical protein
MFVVRIESRSREIKTKKTGPTYYRETHRYLNGDPIVFSYDYIPSYTDSVHGDFMMVMRLVKDHIQETEREEEKELDVVIMKDMMEDATIDRAMKEEWEVY